MDENQKFIYSINKKNFKKTEKETEKCSLIDDFIYSTI